MSTEQLSINFAAAVARSAGRRRPVVLSYGGGLNSWAMLLGAIERGERIDVCVFVDVGDGNEHADGEDPGEWPDTYKHIREHVMPLCRRHGIEFVWVTTADYPVRGQRSFFDWMRHPEKSPSYQRTGKMRGIQVPVASKKSRRCTLWAKVERFEAWMADRFGDTKVTVWIGFEAGEEERVANDPHNNGGGNVNRDNRYPLIEWGWCRCRCELAAREHDAGNVPRKSACCFCPMGTRRDWRALADHYPELFAKIAELEAIKPLTSNGEKMAIKGFGKKRKDGSRKIELLPEWVSDEAMERAAKRTHTKPVPCEVCGAAERATKHTSCGYLTADEFVTGASMPADNVRRLPMAV